MFVLPCAIVALLLLYLSFLCFGLLVRTRSRPYGLCHRPYTLAHIKGFGSLVWHVYACLHLCFMLVLASLVPGLAMFGALRKLDLVWLHPTPIRPCSKVALLGCIAMMPVVLCTFIPFSAPYDIFLPGLFVPPIGFICIFTCFVTCPYMSLAC